VPIKSQAQRRKFAELLVEGKIKPRSTSGGTARRETRIFPSA